MSTDQSDPEVDGVLLRAQRVVDDVLRPIADAAPVVLVAGDGTVARAVAAAALEAGAATVLVQGRPSPVNDADLRLHAPRVLGPLTPEAVRERLSVLSPSGRADVVIAAEGDLAGAARLVRRGGTIGSAVPPTTHPTITTIVQRELVLSASRDRVPAAPTGRPDATGVRTTEGADHGH